MSPCRRCRCAAGLKPASAGQSGAEKRWAARRGAYRKRLSDRRVVPGLRRQEPGEDDADREHAGWCKCRRGGGDPAELARGRAAMLAFAIRVTQAVGGHRPVLKHEGYRRRVRIVGESRPMREGNQNQRQHAKRAHWHRKAVSLARSHIRLIAFLAFLHAKREAAQCAVSSRIVAPLPSIEPEPETLYSSARHRPHPASGRAPVLKESTPQCSPAVETLLIFAGIVAAIYGARAVPWGRFFGSAPDFVAMEGLPPFRTLAAGGASSAGSPALIGIDEPGRCGDAARAGGGGEGESVRFAVWGHAIRRGACRSPISASIAAPIAARLKPNSMRSAPPIRTACGSSCMNCRSSARRPNSLPRASVAASRQGLQEPFRRAMMRTVVGSMARAVWRLPSARRGRGSR
jgi:hypothetical protein